MNTESEWTPRESGEPIALDAAAEVRRAQYEATFSEEERRALSELMGIEYDFDRAKREDDPMYAFNALGALLELLKREPRIGMLAKTSREILL